MAITVTTIIIVGQEILLNHFLINEEECRSVWQRLASENGLSVLY